MSDPIIESTEVVIEEDPKPEPKPKLTLLPEFVREALATLTVGFRATRKAAETAEVTVDAVKRAVIGIDLVATTMLSQQQKRLMAELAED